MPPAVAIVIIPFCIRASVGFELLQCTAASAADAADAAAANHNAFEQEHCAVTMLPI